MNPGCLLDHYLQVVLKVLQDRLVLLVPERLPILIHQQPLGVLQVLLIPGVLPDPGIRFLQRYPWVQGTPRTRAIQWSQGYPVDQVCLPGPSYHYFQPCQEVLLVH